MNESQKEADIFKNFVDPAISNICAASNLKYGFYIENSFRPEFDDQWIRNANSKSRCRFN